MRAILRMKRQEFTEEQLKEAGAQGVAVLEEIALCSHKNLSVHVTFVQCDDCKVSWTTY